MGLLSGKRGVVVGVANERSLAFAIARSARDEGASVAVTYQNERFGRRVVPLAEQLGAAWTAACDVTADAEIAALAAQVERTWGTLDFLVHSVAHAERAELEGAFVDTSRSGFAAAMDVSVYSLVALCQKLRPYFAPGGASVLTLSYYGSRKVLPGYNVMGVAKAALESSVRYLAADLGPQGVRVNALSPGPVKTLSAAGIRGLRTLIGRAAEQAPLRRTVSAAEVGRAALFLLSDLGVATTGEVVHVDAGFHATGSPPPSAPTELP
jgi:enoyl-[acyl-carrier protein] reductase I